MIAFAIFLVAFAIGGLLLVRRQPATTGLEDALNVGSVGCSALILLLALFIVLSSIYL